MEFRQIVISVLIKFYDFRYIVVSYAESRSDAVRIDYLAVLRAVHASDYIHFRFKYLRHSVLRAVAYCRRDPFRIHDDAVLRAAQFRHLDNLRR